MNLQNFDLLIRALRTIQATGNRERFNMRWYFGGPRHRLDQVPSALRVGDPTACGTAACLGGWCQLLGASTPAEKAMSAFDFATEWLGLEYSEAGNLFLGRWHPATQGQGGREDLDGLSRITLEETLAHLEEVRGRAAESEPAAAREREPALS